MRLYYILEYTPVSKNQQADRIKRPASFVAYSGGGREGRRRKKKPETRFGPLRDEFLKPIFYPIVSFDLHASSAYGDPSV